MKPTSLFAVALAAALAPAAVSAAGTTAQASPPFSGGLSVGGFVGWEQDDLSGLALRADVEVPFGALSPQVYLSWVGSVGFSHLTDDNFGNDLTANVLKLVPAARFSFPVNPQFTLFADAGLGLYYSSWEVERPRTFDVDDSEIGLVMRLGGGAWFELSPTARIGAAVELDPYFGDVIGDDDQNTLVLLVGAMFRM